MKNLKFLPTMLSIVFALACLHVSVSGQTTDDKDKIATIYGSGSSVKWDVAAQYSSLTLTVSAPDGQVFRKDLKAGEPVEMTLIDKNGSRLADGQYNYELRLTPEISDDVRKSLAASRGKGGDDQASSREMIKRGLLPARPILHSGSFTILRGSVIVAGGVESNAQRSSKRTAPRRRGLVPARDLPSEAFPVRDVAIIAAHAAATDPPLISWKTNATLPFPDPLLPDQVIPDDLIVQGSLCVGFDCVNNESFGFDTIRLKENNTRIKFEDTSVGSFPTNDWQLTANDSASGGASKFSIEDITGSKVPFTITAGASTNSIFVDSTGRVGFRTSTPVLDMHANTSNTPAIRLEQNNTGGFTAQTWDIAGNEANFFIRDVTGGSKLSFRIRPGAPTSSIDISADGNVGIGTASPGQKIDVVSDATPTVLVRSTSGVADNAVFAMRPSSGGSGRVDFQDSTGAVRAVIGSTSGTDNLVFSTGGAVERMRINSTGNVGIGTTSPTDKLSVNGGNVRVTGGSFIDDGVTLNAPDYVFEDSYRLMTLDQLRAYIARNKHLPNIPSAAEVRQNGLNLSQFQMKLLEKIEELTLHVLSEQEQRKELQKQVEELKAQLRQLQSSAGVSK